MTAAPAQEGMALLSLVSNASLAVQLVLVLLFVASLVSWTMIFRKWRMLADAEAASRDFEKRFWAGGNLGQMFRDLNAREGALTGMEGIFHAGSKEFARLEKQRVDEPAAMLEGAQRAMRVALSREIETLETHLPFLATVGSTSPYIGLFGTVWGIMNSFRALPTASSVTIATVAPGIAEALVATAMGLFAAIPAVIAYNRYSHAVERVVGRYEMFMEEFSSLLHRQAFLSRSQG